MSTTTAALWHHWLLIGYAAASVFVFVVLQFVVKAAYGKHKADKLAWWWGPGVPTRWAWIVMEAPSALGFAVIYFVGERAWDIAPLVFLLMWQAHYFQRSFVYPFIRRVRPGDTTPLLIPVTAFFTNFGVSFLNAVILSWTSVRADYGNDWLLDPRFVAGAVVFAIGYHVNRKADRMLAALRAPGETGYKIPRGWLYEKISCPNYLGEILIWTGWAIATWSWAGVVFVLWTLGNLLPRALSTHKWYREKFADYPAQRRAVIPGVL